MLCNSHRLLSQAQEHKQQKRRWFDLARYAASHSSSPSPATSRSDSHQDNPSGEACSATSSPTSPIPGEGRPDATTPSLGIQQSAESNDEANSVTLFAPPQIDADVGHKYKLTPMFLIYSGFIRLNPHRIRSPFELNPISVNLNEMGGLAYHNLVHLVLTTCFNTCLYVSRTSIRQTSSKTIDYNKEMCSETLYPCLGC